MNKSDSCTAICKLCDKLLASEKNLKLHIAKIHAKKTNVVCEHCAKTIKSTNIKNHVKEMHDNYVETHCPECGKAFPRQKAMYYHLRNVHRKPAFKKKSP